jgi:hypothetical protein
MSDLYALVENGSVANVVLWDGAPGWLPPDGSTAVKLDDGSSVSIGWTYDGASFAAPTSTPTLAAAQASKIAELSAECKAAIVAGFTSSALGAAYTYPAKDTDQQNLASSVIDSLLSNGAAGWVTPFWCADASGAWAFRMHTAAQIQKVGQDAKAAVLAAMVKNQTLAGQVAAASTVAAVSAIAWG